MTTNARISDGANQQHQVVGQYEFRDVVYCKIFSDVHKLLDYDNYRHDDVILATYPKSGTNWMQDIMFAITQDGNTEQVGVRDTQGERVPFLENTGIPWYRPAFEVLPEMTSPRLIKTHMKREFFDNAFRKNVKFVVLNRNPKDVIGSYYHFYKMIPSIFQFDGDFNEFFELFKNKKLVHGDWFDWVLGWWQERDNPNVHFVTYEKMKKDILKETRWVAKFLGKEFSDEAIHKIVASCSFDNLKEKTENDVIGSVHFRKGVVGDWANYFTPEQAAYVDELYKSKMAHIDIGFE